MLKYINLAGHDRPLRFNARVLKLCTERFGSIENIDTALEEGSAIDRLDNAIFLLAAMMDGGAKWCDHEGIDHYPALSEDEIYDLCDISDLAHLAESIREAITEDNKVEVEAEPAKKAEAPEER